MYLFALDAGISETVFNSVWVEEELRMLVVWWLSEHASKEVRDRVRRETTGKGFVCYALGRESLFSVFKKGGLS